VGLEDVGVAGTTGGLEVDLPGEPDVGQIAHGRPGPLGVDVGAGLHGRGDLVEPSLGVDLALEVAGVFLAVFVAVPRPVRAVRPPRD
jgi:hypothetical protein